MTPQRKTKMPEPYKDSLEHLLAELGWLRAMIEVVLLGRAEANAMDANRASKAWRHGQPLVLGAAEKAHTEAKSMRQDIDERIEASRAAGVRLGLDEITRANDLTQIERTLLLALTAPIVHPATAEKLAEVSSNLFRSGLELDAVSTLLDLSSAERIAGLKALLPSGKLLASGLIAPSQHAITSPGDAMISPYFVTWRGLGAVLADEQLLLDHLPGEANE